MDKFELIYSIDANGNKKYWTGKDFTRTKAFAKHYRNATIAIKALQHSLNFKRNFGVVRLNYPKNNSNFALESRDIPQLFVEKINNRICQRTLFS
jgi:hypothetical protein